MDKSIFEKISMNGRISYAIICSEFYVITKYPDLDWTPVFKRLWSITSCESWDEWSDMIMEVIPEYLFEFPDYESSGFEYISKDEYTTLTKLYHTTENDTILNTLLLKIKDIESRYCYSNIPGIGEASLIDVREIESILISNSIDIPDPNLVTFSKFSERNGWGNKFPASKIATII